MESLPRYYWEKTVVLPSIILRNSDYHSGLLLEYSGYSVWSTPSVVYSQVLGVPTI
jgi:hypothetical protein